MKNDEDPFENIGKEDTPTKESLSHLPRKGRTAYHCTKVEKIQRVEETVQMILNLDSHPEMRKHLMETYEIGEAAARSYIQMANDEIKKTYKPNIPALINTHVHKYHAIAKRTEVEDPRSSIMALQALEKLLRLTGNYDGVQINTQVNFSLDGIDTDDLTNMLKAIGNQHKDDDTQINRYIEVNDDNDDD